MASLLRQIVASPRARHPEAGLDLCYVTDNIIATSGPSSVWPKKAYRNPTDHLVKFLDEKHQADWSIFEFRAEGTGYPDSEVYNRIHHFPWPDHHPPPFAIIPSLMASMRNWIQGESLDGLPNNKSGASKQRRVAVVHCKAGKGRSGTAACSYLISEEGWKKADALQRFTDRRMRVGFGNGVSIPSQLRWVGYVDRWANQMQKRYIERPVEIVELHIWGLRDGVKVAVEGYVENGRQIQGFHIFQKNEKIMVDDANSVADESKAPQVTSPKNLSRNETTSVTGSATQAFSSTSNLSNESKPRLPDGAAVLFKPSSRLILPTSDINIDFERRNKAAYTGWTMVTSVAHVWFNAYFEGGHEGNDSGVFEIDWEAMDGIKGSARKGTKAIDRLKVVWKYVRNENAGMQPLEQIITEPAKGEPISEPEPADWRGDEDKDAAAEASRSGGLSSGRPGGAMLTVGATIVAGAESLGRDLGLRKANPSSAEISRASSVESTPHSQNMCKGRELAKDEMETEADDRVGMKSHGPAGEEELDHGHVLGKLSGLEETERKADTKVGRVIESGVENLGSMIPGRTKTTNSRNEYRKEIDD